MPLFKKVNGQPVEMTPEEEAALLAEWAENALPPTPEELEAEVQKVTDQILQNDERDVAMAMATVDLVMAARDGQLAGLTRAQVRDAYRDRVLFYLRERRGI